MKKAIFTFILVCVINIINAMAQIGADVRYYYNNSSFIIDNLESPTGGDGNYQFQWEELSGPAVWQAISGATGETLQVTSAGSYRRKVTSAGQTAYSNIAVVYSSTVDMCSQGDSICMIFNIPSQNRFDRFFNVFCQDPNKQAFTIKWKQYDGVIKMTVFFSPNYQLESFENISAPIRLLYYDDSPKHKYYDMRFSYNQPTNYTEQNTASSSETRYLAAGGGNPQHTNIYYDEMGRVSQYINMAASPSGGDVVSFTMYDQMGRNDSITYMPYVKSDNGGQKVLNPCSEQVQFYRSAFPGDNDAYYAYSSKYYAYASINLVLSSTSPGELSGKEEGGCVQLYTYRNNKIEDSLKIFRIAADGKSLIYDGYYSAGKIQTRGTWVDQPHDSLMRWSFEFFNSAGQVIAKQSRCRGNRLTTYYVYDDMGQLRYQIPPMQDAFLNNPGTYTYEDLKKYCFYDEYDEYGRIIKQYVPGAEPVYSIYDLRGRVAMTQSGAQRIRNEWSFIKYDDLDRPVISGVITGGSYESHREALNEQNVFGETRDDSFTCYTDMCYPTSIDSSNVLNVNFYDDYTWIKDDLLLFTASRAFHAAPSYNVIGQKTGGKTKVLGVSQAQWLTSVVYYDQEYRSIQSISELYPKGLEIVSNKHDFTGNVTQTQVWQLMPMFTLGYNKWFNYDGHGRLKSIDQQIVNDYKNVKVKLVAYKYDDLGNMVKKLIHNGLDTTIMEYRVNGSLTASTSKDFSYRLGMDRPASAGLPSRPDGFISSVAWGNGLDPDKAYNYDYDWMGYMKTAGFAEKIGTTWSQSLKYNEKDISYDRNGNITSLGRYGDTGNKLHDIGYNYEAEGNGNAVSSISMGGQISATFEYDADGNMIKDGLSGVEISYNALGLPEKIFAGTDTITYIYNAAGNKLATVAGGSLTYYRSVAVYSASAAAPAVEHLQYINQPEGIIVPDANRIYTYKYFKTDHIGSTRVLLAAVRNADSQWSLEPEQYTDYYPFGMAWETNNLQLNRYLFSGKELQDANVGSLGMLGLYDFGARYYNPILGRWFNVDPALQGVNPYAYCGNLPHMAVDPDGEFFFFDNLVIGFFKGLFRGKNPFKTAWRDGLNDLKVWGGLFNGNFGQILSRLTWEFPQTITGFIASQGNITFGNVEDVDYYGGATVLQNHKSGWGAFTLGSYIIGDNSIRADPSNTLFQHEYGHYLQSQAAGPLYLAKYAVPSFYDAMKAQKDTHKLHPVEQDANARALKYFEEKYPGFADARTDQNNYGWNHYKNIIIGYDKNRKGGYNHPDNKAALKTAKLKAYGNVWDGLASALSFILPLPVQTLGIALPYERGYQKMKEQNIVR